MSASFPKEVAPSETQAFAKDRIEIVELLGNRREITILHNGDEYRLRVTANNKLILTK